MQHHQHQRVAAQRPFAGVIDSTVARPFLHHKDQGSHPDISWLKQVNLCFIETNVHTEVEEIAEGELFSAPTVGVTSQKKGVPDSHRVVNVEIKLQIAVMCKKIIRNGNSNLISINLKKTTSVIIQPIPAFLSEP